MKFSKIIGFAKLVLKIQFLSLTKICKNIVDYTQNFKKFQFFWMNVRNSAVFWNKLNITQWILKVQLLDNFLKFEIIALNLIII